MADVVNRTTKQYLRSVNTGDYPAQDWIINPDLSAVTGQPTKYWLISGDTVSLMNQSQRNAADAQELSDQRDATAGQFDQTEDIIRALALTILSEINALRTIESLPNRTAAQLKTAIRNKLGS